VLDSLQQLRNTLQDRAKATANLNAVVRKKQKSPRDEAAIAKRTELLAAREASLAEARALIERELNKARQAEAELRSKLGEAQPAQANGEPSRPAAGANEQLLSNEIKRAAARVRILEAAHEVETTGEFDALLTRNAGVLAEEPKPFRPGAAGFAEWPGISVPERLTVLFREVKRNPQAKRPIIISAAAVGALALIIVGLAVTSGLRNDAGNTPDLLGRGEVLAPVFVDGAVDAGAIELTIEYDSEILTARNVIPGGLARDADIDYDVTTDGTVTVKVTSSDGITGSGELVFIIFRTNHIVVDPVALTVSDAAVYGLDGNSELQVESEDGWADTYNMTCYAPVLHLP
jgi:hypothetical protein